MTHLSQKPKIWPSLVQAADSDLETEILCADVLDLGFDDADIRKLLISLRFTDDNDDAPSTHEDVAVKDLLSVLNDAEALLQECINKRLWDDDFVASRHEEIWSVADGFLLWVLATADFTKLKF